MKSSNIGGQAVLEGIMMKSGSSYSVAVRKQDGQIESMRADHKNIIPIKKLTAIPFVRGVFNFIDSMVLGMKSLNYSASFYEEETGQLLTIEDANKQKKKDDIMMALTMIISMCIAIVGFMLLPYYLIQLMSDIIASRLLQVAVEGCIRIGIFVGYILLVSRMEDIRRTFMYHGAEHKCINCIESGMELTIENVRKSSKEHKRCGTSFIFFVLLVSMVCLFFIDVDSVWTRLLVRILMLPLIAGISYELIKWAGSSDNKIIALLSVPGLWMQELTTKEPDDDMIEVAIVAVENVFDWREFIENSREEYKKDI